ncbi:MAG: SDR family NAD(P)-dependent oxidoreductase [Paracoccus sp. (in: a-proteobacteria)]|uniref:SDR family NAD(P)-dependent oxidoreductase n=1 Tax=Paracoccus sp. TaxID=267 RepID=UPI0040584C59
MTATLPRRVLVAGGCGGIGRAVVTALLAQGDEVAILDLPLSLDRHPPPPGVLSRPVDASDPASVTAAVGALGGEWPALDGMVNLVGFAPPPVPVSDLAPEIWSETIAGNLGAGFLLARAALPLLRKGRQASMVNVASGLALKSTPGYGAYAAAKAGMLALTRVLAQENAPGVRVNAVAPSAVDTAFLSGGTGRGGEDGAPVMLDTEAYLRTIPMGRLATPEDVLGPILFLLSPAAGYVTGQTLHVNGGTLMV